MRHLPGGYAAQGEGCGRRDGTATALHPSAGRGQEEGTGAAPGGVWTRPPKHRGWPPPLLLAAGAHTTLSLSEPAGPSWRRPPSAALVFGRREARAAADAGPFSPSRLCRPRPGQPGPIGLEATAGSGGEPPLSAPLSLGRCWAVSPAPPLRAGRGYRQGLCCPPSGCRGHPFAGPARPGLTAGPASPAGSLRGGAQGGGWCFASARRWGRKRLSAGCRDLGSAPKDRSCETLGKPDFRLLLKEFCDTVECFMEFKVLSCRENNVNV